MKVRPIVGFVMGLLLHTPAIAEDIGSFFKGKTLTMIVSNSAGGGYDLMTRTIARHIGKHLRGSPAVVVQNMPGAGGLIAANYLYSVAPRDGTVLASLSNNVPFEPLFGTKDARFEPTRLHWLGSPSVETGIVTVWNTVPVKSLEDARRRGMTVPANGANSTPSFYARLLNDTLGTKMRIILGYPGQNEMYTAMERGEVDANSSVFYSSLVATRANWLRDKQIALLVQYGLDKNPNLADVPFAPELVSSEDDKKLMYAAFAPLAVGRPYALPQGVPESG
jgi:tripartite-type tricarboxylate transporter receptor subunit TctC